MRAAASLLALATAATANARAAGAPPPYTDRAAFEAAFGGRTATHPLDGFTLDPATFILTPVTGIAFGALAVGFQCLLGGNVVGVASASQDPSRVGCEGFLGFALAAAFDAVDIVAAPGEFHERDDPVVGAAASTVPEPGARALNSAFDARAFVGMTSSGRQCFTATNAATTDVAISYQTMRADGTFVGRRRLLLLPGRGASPSPTATAFRLSAADVAGANRLRVFYGPLPLITVALPPNPC